MRQRIHKTCLFLSGLLAAGIGYYLFGRYSGFYLPCLFHKVTGLYCPGCGITSLFIALFQGDFSRALHSNMALFLLMPVLAGIFAGLILRYIKTGSTAPSAAMNRIITVILFILVLFGILRNLPWFSFLRPLP